MRYEREHSRWRLFFGVGLFLGLVILIYATARPRVSLTPPEVWLQEGLAPVQRVLTGVGNTLASGFRQVVAWSRLERENEAYRQRLGRLEEQLSRMEEYRQENRRLRALLGFRDRLGEDVDLLAARVIGRNPTNWFSTITVDRGETDGVRKEMAVITPAGVVGVVQATTPHTATILLIVDAKAAVGGKVQANRTLVLVEGKPDQPGWCQVKGLTAEVKLKRGDVVITSGLGDIFPPGLPLGKITRVGKGKYGLTRYGSLKPAVDFSRLEEVFIIRKVRRIPPVWLEKVTPPAAKGQKGERTEGTSLATAAGRRSGGKKGNSSVGLSGANSFSPPAEGTQTGGGGRQGESTQTERTGGGQVRITPNRNPPGDTTLPAAADQTVPIPLSPQRSAGNDNSSNSASNPNQGGEQGREGQQ